MLENQLDLDRFDIRTHMGCVYPVIGLKGGGALTQRQAQHVPLDKNTLLKACDFL